MIDGVVVRELAVHADERGRFIETFRKEWVPGARDMIQANRADRQAAMKFAFQNAGVDCVTVGYKNTAEIDEAIENLNLALA